MRVYVASSWRNPHQPAAVRYLRSNGFEVYDFRAPSSGGAFRWSDIDPGWEGWSPARYREALGHPLAETGFASDMGALAASDAVVLVQPCGRSSHLELGWAVGAGKLGIVLLDEAIEPELMVKMATMCLSLGEVRGVLTRAV